MSDEILYLTLATEYNKNFMAMTVKEVFELRKQGKIEEAYAAILPMYASHKGKYTTLCMFWTASDILKKRIEEKRVEDAEQIFKALLRLLPSIDDSDGKAHSAVLNDALRIDEASAKFSMLDFIDNFGADKLTDGDWEGATSEKGFKLPSTAQRILTRCFHELREKLTAEQALKMMPLLQATISRNPYNKHNRRYMAVVYSIMGKREKAVALYRQMLSRHHDSYLYAELAELTDDAGKKAALYCHAIQKQRQENFRCGYRLQLARLLVGRDNAKAAYELQNCVDFRKASGYHITRDIQQLLQKTRGAIPSTDAQQADFYRLMINKYPV